MSTTPEREALAREEVNRGTPMKCGRREYHPLHDWRLTGGLLKCPGSPVMCWRCNEGEAHSPSGLCFTVADPLPSGEAAPDAGTGTGEPLERQIGEVITRHHTNGLCPLDGPCEMCDCFHPQHDAEREMAAAVMAVVQPALDAARREALEERAENWERTRRTLPAPDDANAPTEYRMGFEAAVNLCIADLRTTARAAAVGQEQGPVTEQGEGER